MGASFLSGLVGTIPVVTGGDVSSSWLAEAGTSSVSKMSFSKATMSPKRNAITVKYTKDLLAQTSFDVHNCIMNKILDKQIEGIMNVAINGTGSNNQPTGILSTSSIGSVAGGTNGAAIPWANVFGLETAVNSANADGGKRG